MTETTRPPDTEGSPPEPVRADPRWRARTARARAWAEDRYKRLEELRPAHAVVEIGFRWLERDIRIAGGVLGGGLAYRFFFYLLALSVLVTGGLGFASQAEKDIASASEDVGLTQAVADTVGEAAAQSQSGRFWLLLTGIVLVLWFSWGLLRALRLVHASAWSAKLAPVRNPVGAVASVLGVTVIILAFLGTAGWVRAQAGVLPGVMATLAITGVIAALWVWVSAALPSFDVRWTAFLPGAVLLAVGFEALHVFAVYFLANKLASSSALYGGLGLAATALFYLFLLGRLVVWAAELNAVAWYVRHPESAPGPETGGDRAQ